MTIWSELHAFYYILLDSGNKMEMAHQPGISH